MDYSLVQNHELNRYSESILKSMNKSKGEIFKTLSDQSITFDYALPQNWLNWFAKESGLEYHLILSTTVWVYKGWTEGPVSCCGEVQFKLEELHYKEK